MELREILLCNARAVSFLNLANLLQTPASQGRCSSLLNHTPANQHDSVGCHLRALMQHRLQVFQNKTEDFASILRFDSIGSALQLRNAVKVSTCTGANIDGRIKENVSEVTIKPSFSSGEKMSSLSPKSLPTVLEADPRVPSDPKVLAQAPSMKKPVNSETTSGSKQRLTSERNVSVSRTPTR